VQAAEAIVEITLDKLARRVLPGKMLCPACVQKVFRQSENALESIELSTPEISRQTFTEQFC
jgi:hypothetical protein